MDLDWGRFKHFLKCLKHVKCVLFVIALLGTGICCKCCSILHITLTYMKDYVTLLQIRSIKFKHAMSVFITSRMTYESRLQLQWQYLYHKIYWMWNNFLNFFFVSRRSSHTSCDGYVFLVRGHKKGLLWKIMGFTLDQWCPNTLSRPKRGSTKI